MNTAVHADDVALGQKALGHALQALALGASLALAWSASTVMMTIVLTLCWWVALSILAALIHFAVLWYTSEETFASVGRGLGSVTGRIAGLFSRKVAA